MEKHEIKPARNLDANSLVRVLTEKKVPFQDIDDGKSRRLIIGPDGEYEVYATYKGILSKSSKVISRASVLVRYEHPPIKNILHQWLEDCNVETSEEFYKWFPGLSPTIVRGIQSQWKVDLSALPAIPIRFSDFVFVFMFSENATEAIKAQLSAIPYRALQKDESIRSDVFAVTGKDPLDTIVYRWSNDSGRQLIVTISSAPATTLLCLWFIPRDGPVEVNLTEAQI